MATNKKELVRGLKYELAALPLLLLSPIIITIGYKAIKFQQNYLWLILGIVMALAAIIIGYLGIKIMLDALFNKK
jgi:thiol:disulfide interchange protein